MISGMLRGQFRRAGLALARGPVLWERITEELGVPKAAYVVVPYYSRAAQQASAKDYDYY